MKQFTFLVALCALAVLTGSVAAQISTSSVTVGGMNTPGCQGGGNPPPLTGGVLASATVDFTYDASTDVLQVVLTNTSPIVAGESNPIATRIHFNLPHGAISAISLTSQTAAAGAPAFGFAYDTDLTDGVNPIFANCFGDMGADLSVQGSSGGIANAAAPSPGGSNYVTGPAVFTFAVTRAVGSTIVAESFARGYSVNGIPTNVAVKFQGGGVLGDESGVLASGGSCEPALWLLGEPKIGTTVSFVRSGYPGCVGCIVVSDSPGPSIIQGHLYPIGLPAFVLTTGAIPSGSIVSFDLPIPSNVALVGQTFYAFQILFNPPGAAESSAQIQATVLP